MDFLTIVIPFVLLVILANAGGALINYSSKKRGFGINPYYTYLLLFGVVTALYLVSGFSMWTVKGIVSI